ncbi:MAG: glycosyltransferase family 2 protein [bacterium]
MKKEISVIIFAHNDQNKIANCITSTKTLTNNIFVLDIGSTDKTSKIAESMGAKIYKTKFVRYVEPVREIGIGLANTQWVLLLDADELISNELNKEISLMISDPKSKKSFNKNLDVKFFYSQRSPTSSRIPAQKKLTSSVLPSSYSSYWIPRKNVFAGKKWLKYGGWWPDYQIRLINKNFFIKWPKQIHSTPVIKGECGYLKKPIIHNFHGDFENMVNKTLIFEDIESNLLYKGKKNANTLIFMRKFLGEFYRRLIKKFGFLDGPIGIIEGVYQSFSKTITYLLLYEKKKNRPV